MGGFGFGGAVRHLRPAEQGRGQGFTLRQSAAGGFDLGVPGTIMRTGSSGADQMFGVVLPYEPGVRISFRLPTGRVAGAIIGLSGNDVLTDAGSVAVRQSLGYALWLDRTTGGASRSANYSATLNELLPPGTIQVDDVFAIHQTDPSTVVTRRNGEVIDSFVLATPHNQLWIKGTIIAAPPAGIIDQVTITGQQWTPAP